MPTVIVELDVTVNPVGNWPTFELLGFDDRIKIPLPFASVVIDPTLVPSTDTSSVVLTSAPFKWTRRISVVVPSLLVYSENTARPTVVVPLLSVASNRETLVF